jgi:hypothetical protein
MENNLATSWWLTPNVPMQNLNIGFLGRPMACPFNSANAHDPSFVNG